MKAATKTIDGILAKRKRRISSQKQNLCLDKGYDFQEIEHESIKDTTIYHTYVREEKIVA
jgi:hypothetical protein